MTIALFFWIIMLLWLLFGAAPHVHSRAWPALGASLLPWLAAAALGWVVFGPIIKA
jgi:hypothetical protein